MLSLILLLSRIHIRPRSFPTRRSSDLCKSCAHCPWMAMNALQGVVACLEQGSGEIRVDEPDFAAALLQARDHALQCVQDRKSTRLNSSHEWISYAVFCLKKKK